MKCPFCNEEDFDLIGLKYHLLTYCEEFRKTLSVEEERRKRYDKNNPLSI